ncbi:MAG TPA: carboxypeptidase-like regulatory domain-containing protein, partial [Paludibacteraceae bacterium]|nr:carboxypeptidase-like regulatory domain-containing protein [Paludibacteraceae bacterium]
MKLNNSFLHRITKRILLSGVAFLFLSTGTLAQETVVVGQVLDKYDKSPISTVDIYFKNSNRAVQSNDDGYFLIRNNGPETTLIFTIVGYKPYELKLKRGDNVGVQIELEEKKNILDEVLVLPGINP